MSKLKLLKIGYVLSSHGTKGEINVKFFKSNVPLSGDKVYFERDTDLKGPVSINSIRKKEQNWIIKIPGCETLEYAKNLYGYSIGITKPYLSENTYWIDDIIGCKVYTDKSLLIGEIKEILSTGANDVYVVRTTEGKEKLIPAIKSVISRVDVTKKEIIVNPMPDLFEEE